jgi:hypothetical protein
MATGIKLYLSFPRRLCDRVTHLLVQFGMFCLIEYIQLLRTMKILHQRRVVGARLKIDPHYAAAYQGAAEVRGERASGGG